jgi:NADH:ubiquinone oxidoreductase subunit 4 (subunit M)
LVILETAVALAAITAAVSGSGAQALGLAGLCLMILIVGLYPAPFFDLMKEKASKATVPKTKLPPWAARLLILALAVMLISFLGPR